MNNSYLLLKKEIYSSGEEEREINSLENKEINSREKEKDIIHLRKKEI